MLGVALLLILAAIYTVVGFYTAWIFRKDKRASENGEWRISEKKLLTFMWLFGVFGAAVGKCHLLDYLLDRWFVL